MASEESQASDRRQSTRDRIAGEGDFPAEKKSFKPSDEESRSTGMKLVLVPKRR